MKESKANIANIKTNKGWTDDEHCYGCGRKNPKGFQLKFFRDGQALVSEVVFRKEHQGYENVVHGGFLALVLDEVMLNAPIHVHDVVVVTVEFTIRYKKMVKVGERISLRGEIVEHKSRKYQLRGEARTNGGILVAEATAIGLRV